MLPGSAFTSLCPVLPTAWLSPLKATVSSLWPLPGLRPLGLDPPGHSVLLLFLTYVFLITHELGQLGVFACFKKTFSQGNVPLFYLFGHTIQ